MADDVTIRTTKNGPLTVGQPVGQPGGERAARCELERGAERVADGRAEHRPDDLVVVRSRDRVVRAVRPGGQHQGRDGVPVAFPVTLHGSPRRPVAPSPRHASVNADVASPPSRRRHVAVTSPCPPGTIIVTWDPG